MIIKWGRYFIPDPYFQTMIDIHSHILPGLDDGASDVEESLAMAKIALNDGIHTIIATPHILNGIYPNSRSTILTSTDELRAAFAKEQIKSDLFPGSEAHLNLGMAEKIFSGEAVTLNDNQRYLLLEFPFHSIPPGAKQEIFQLQLKGITPVLAHAERNYGFQQHLKELYEFVSMGCLVQITAMSITGNLGREARLCAQKMLECRLAHIIATDAHSAAHRPPILSIGVKKSAKILGSTEQAEAMVTSRPAAILAGEKVVIPEPEEPAKKRWFFLF
jgi:protein-tyrosine phosphatase